MTLTPTVIIPRSVIREFSKATSSLEKLFITEKTWELYEYKKPFSLTDKQVMNRKSQTGVQVTRRRKGEGDSTLHKAIFPW